MVRALIAGPRPLLRGVRQIAQALDSPAVASFVALLVYATVAARHPGGFKPSQFNYFNYLADAFLHGQFHLRVPPASTHDLSEFGGKLFLYWSPFPAIVLVPFVALWGVHFSDVLFTVVFGAANVGLVSVLLRAAALKGIARLSRLKRSLMVLFFTFGTVHFTLAPFGRVWFTAQVVGFGCVLVAYWAAIRLRDSRAFVTVGVAMTFAFLTRNDLALTGLWPGAYLLWAHRREHLNVLVRRVLIAATPVLLGLGLLAIYNTARFGSVLENGLRFHQVGYEFAQDYARFGAFHPHYVLMNLYYQYVFYPLPFREGSYWGGGLFWMSPVFFGAFAGLCARPFWSAWTMATSIFLSAVPILLLMGTGFVQWGPRYTLDFTVPLLLLSAKGIRRWPVALLALLVFVSVLNYVYGAVQFMRYL